ncbi:MAG TPA: hypothetical protein VME66_00960 [Candidatus Acidoferrales bacterium]|nr:hypothetical protein [Candidatus Acidoferrales bacterium]
MAKRMRLLRPSSRLLVAIAVLGGAAGCIPVGVWVPPAGPTPSPSAAPTACAPLSEVPSAPLVFPVPSSTNVPTTAGKIVVQTSPGPLAELVDNGTVVVQGALQADSSPAPIPTTSPATLPGDALPLAELAYPALAPQTTYTVEVQLTLTDLCAGTSLQWIPEGSFTTGS